MQLNKCLKVPIFHTNEVPPIAPQMLVFWGNKWVTFKLKFVIFVAFLRAKRAEAHFEEMLDWTNSLTQPTDCCGMGILCFSLVYPALFTRFLTRFVALRELIRGQILPLSWILWNFAHTLWNKDEQSQFFRYFPFSLFTNFQLHFNLNNFIYKLH